MFQQIILVGNLGSDPEMRFTGSGVPVANFSLAVNERWTGQDGQQQEKTIWFRVAAWRKTAEIVSQYLKKGAKVMITGKVEPARAWTDRDGNLQASIEVTAYQVQFLDSANSSGGNGSAPQSQSAPTQQSAQQPPQRETISDEDIPF